MIEKCVCGGEARFDGEWVSCYACGREGEVFTFGEPDARAKAIAAWNHDQRGLRLLREVADAWSQCFYPSPYLVNKVFAWAEEGDRE